jgi:hypothetical protein
VPYLTHLWANEKDSELTCDGELKAAAHKEDDEPEMQSLWLIITSRAA